MHIFGDTKKRAHWIIIKSINANNQIYQSSLLSHHDCSEREAVKPARWNADKGLRTINPKPPGLQTLLRRVFYGAMSPFKQKSQRRRTY